MDVREPPGLVVEDQRKTFADGLLSLRLQMDVHRVEMVGRLRSSGRQEQTTTAEREQFINIVTLACTLQTDASWVDSSRQAAVLQANAPSLRLYHVLDLLRLAEGFKAQMDFQQPELLPVLLAMILQPFTSQWIPIGLDVAEAQKQVRFKNTRALQGIMGIFYPRWGDIRSGFVLNKDYSEPVEEANKPNSGLRKRPLVCSII